jgi:hypothetical protein
MLPFARIDHQHLTNFLLAKMRLGTSQTSVFLAAQHMYYTRTSRMIRKSINGNLDHGVAYTLVIPLAMPGVYL